MSVTEQAMVHYHSSKNYFYITVNRLFCKNARRKEFTASGYSTREAATFEALMFRIAVGIDNASQWQSYNDRKSMHVHQTANVLRSDENNVDLPSVYHQIFLDASNAGLHFMDGTSMPANPEDCTFIDQLRAQHQLGLAAINATQKRRRSRLRKHNHRLMSDVNYLASLEGILELTQEERDALQHGAHRMETRDYKKSHGFEKQ